MDGILSCSRSWWGESSTTAGGVGPLGRFRVASLIESASNEPGERERVGRRSSPCPRSRPRRREMKLLRRLLLFTPVRCALIRAHYTDSLYELFPKLPGTKEADVADRSPFLPTSSLSAVPPATDPRTPIRHNPDSPDTPTKHPEWSSNRTRAGECSGSASATFLPSSSSAIPSSLAVPDHPHPRDVPACLACARMPLPAETNQAIELTLHASLGLLSCAFAAVNGPSRATPTWPTMP